MTRTNKTLYRLFSQNEASWIAPKIVVNLEEFEQFISWSSKQGGYPQLDCVSLSNAAFSGKNFDELRATYSIFNEVTFTKCHFTFCNFLGASFKSCRFIGCEFTHCTLADIALQDCTFRGSSFEECDMLNMQWQGVDNTLAFIDLPNTRPTALVYLERDVFKGEFFVSCGCFWGTFEDFVERVRQKSSFDKRRIAHEFIIQQFEPIIRQTTGAKSAVDVNLSNIPF